MIRRLQHAVGCGLMIGAMAQAFARSESAAEPPSLPLETIVARMTDRAASDAGRTNTAPHRWRRVTVIEDYDSKGRLEQRKTKEHFVVGREGAFQATLVKINDRPLTEREQAKERKRELENRDRYAQRNDRQGRFELDADMIQRFRYQWLSNDIVDGRWNYVLKFSPAAEAERSKVADRVLASLGGRIWVDADVFEVSRIEAELQRDINIGGFIAELSDLGFLIERRPLPEGDWVSVRLDSHAAGRKLFDRFSGHMVVRQEDFEPVLDAAPGKTGSGTAAAASPP